MKVMVTQSNFLPWRGFFASLFSVDKIVFLENVQYTKRDWRNRNILRKNLEDEKGCWISVPIIGGGSRSQLLSDVKIDGLEQFYSKFINKINNVYKKADFFSELFTLQSVFLDNKGDNSLSALNIRLIKEICYRLKINIEFDSVCQASNSPDPSQRILEIVMAHKGETYVTGLAAKNYLNNNLFMENNIKISYITFSRLPKGERMMSDLGYEFSIVDTIARMGFEKTRELTCVEI